MSKVRVGRRLGLRPVAIPLVDPVVEWTDRPRRSEAGRDGLRLVVVRVGGGWAYEIYRSEDRRPTQAGAMAGWTRAHAKEAAVGQGAVLWAQATAGAGSPIRVNGPRQASSRAVQQRLPLEPAGDG